MFCFFRGLYFNTVQSHINSFCLVSLEGYCGILLNRVISCSSVVVVVLGRAYGVVGCTKFVLTFQFIPLRKDQVGSCFRPYTQTSQSINNKSCALLVILLLVCSPVQPITNIVPLVLVLGVSLIKEAFEDNVSM